MGYAMLYKHRILPLSKCVVESIHEYFETFSLSYEEWIECLPDIADQAHQHAKEAKFVAAVHKELLTDLKKAQDQADIVVAKLKLDIEAVRTKRSVTSILREEGTTSLLLLIPIVSSFYAIHILRKAAIKRAVAENDRQINGIAAEAISTELAPALEQFICAMEGYASFFSVLESRIRKFGDNAKEARMYYRLSKGRASEICAATIAYIGNIPLIESDLDSIPPLEGERRNYVHQWFADRNNTENNKSYIEWAKEVFRQRTMFPLLTEDMAYTE